MTGGGPHPRGTLSQHGGSTSHDCAPEAHPRTPPAPRHACPGRASFSINSRRAARRQRGTGAHRRVRGVRGPGPFRDSSPSRRCAQFTHLTGAPDFGPNVCVSAPSMPQSQIQATVDSIPRPGQAGNQFGTQRYALLFSRAPTAPPPTRCSSRWATTPAWPAWAPRRATSSSTARSIRSTSAAPAVAPRW